jgi:hypothetical protein
MKAIVKNVPVGDKKDFQGFPDSFVFFMKENIGRTIDVEKSDEIDWYDTNFGMHWHYHKDWLEFVPE